MCPRVGLCFSILSAVKSIKTVKNRMKMLIIKKNVRNVTRYVVSVTHCVFLNKFPSHRNKLDRVWEPAEMQPGHQRVFGVLKFRKAQVVKNGIDASFSCHLQH